MWSFKDFKTQIAPLPTAFSPNKNLGARSQQPFPPSPFCPFQLQGNFLSDSGPLHSACLYLNILHLRFFLPCAFWLVLILPRRAEADLQRPFWPHACLRVSKIRHGIWCLEKNIWGMLKNITRNSMPWKSGVHAIQQQTKTSHKASILSGSPFDFKLTTNN